MTPDPNAPANRRALAALCCVVMFVYALYLGAVGVVLPFVGNTFALSPERLGRLFPANFAGFVVGVLICGYLSDTRGRKVVLLSGIVLYAVGLTLFGFAPVYGVALAASALIGAGSGAMEAVASALASDLYPQRRAVMVNLIQVAFGAGAALGPWMAHSRLLKGVDWRLLYLGLAAVNGVLFLALATQSVPRAPHGEAVDFSALRVALRSPAFGLLCLAQAIYVGAETGFFSWMPTYFAQRLPGGMALAGLVVTVFWIGIVVGRIATVALLGRISILGLLLRLSAGGVVFSALALTTQNPFVVMGFVCLTGLCFSGMFGLILSEAGERFPAVSGSAFGGVVASGGIGGAIIPWMVAALSTTALDWRGALAVVPLLTLIIGVLVLLLSKIR